MPGVIRSAAWKSALSDRDLREVVNHRLSFAAVADNRSPGNSRCRDNSYRTRHANSPAAHDWACRAARADNRSAGFPT